MKHAHGPYKDGARNQQRDAIQHALDRARCNGRDHRNHAEVTCAGNCCSACGGPIDDDEECRC